MLLELHGLSVLSEKTRDYGGESRFIYPINRAHIELGNRWIDYHLNGIDTGPFGLAVR